MVWITFFGSDGWELDRATWHDDDTGPSLESVIQKLTEIPSEEATRITASSLDEWQDKGHQEADTRNWRRVRAYLVAIFGLAAAGIAAVVWLLVRFLT